MYQHMLKTGQVSTSISVNGTDDASNSNESQSGGLNDEDSDIDELSIIGDFIFDTEADVRLADSDLLEQQRRQQREANGEYKFDDNDDDDDEDVDGDGIKKGKHLRGKNKIVGTEFAGFKAGTRTTLLSQLRQREKVVVESSKHVSNILAAKK